MFCCLIKNARSVDSPGVLMLCLVPFKAALFL